MTAPLGAWETDPAETRRNVPTNVVPIVQPIVVNRQMSEVTADAVRAIVTQNSVSPAVFRSGGRLARIARETDDNGCDVTLVRMFNAGGLRGYLARAAVWHLETNNGVADRPPPREVVDDLLGNADTWEDIPILRQIVHCPVFAANGTLHAEPGYSTITRCWYEPRGQLALSELPTEPTDLDVASARDLLLHDYLGDFPFEGPADRAHALALLLLPFIRHMIPGPTPLHLIEASTPGTGKGLLGKAIFLLSHGAEVPSMTECRDDAEWSKSLTAKFASGQPIVFIDNVVHPLRSGKLAAALTQPIWEERLLGGSRMLVAPIRHVFVATGNNVSLSGEIVRRTVRCRMNARVEQPWLRNGFRHEDLIAWGLTERSRLVRAALILVRAWLARGRPNWSGRPLGSFEDWSRTLGGILEVAGSGHFLGNLQQFYDAAIDDVEEDRSFVHAWYERFGSTEVLARDLIIVANQVDPPEGTFADLLREKVTSKSLARRLRALHGRVYDDLEVVHIPRKGKADLYKIGKVINVGKESGGAVA